MNCTMDSHLGDERWREDSGDGKGSREGNENMVERQEPKKESIVRAVVMGSVSCFRVYGEQEMEKAIDFKNQESLESIMNNFHTAGKAKSNYMNNKEGVVVLQAASII